MKMVIANIDSTCTRCGGLWQYDYGQVLRIQGLNLPAAVEIHFSLTDQSGESITRIGTTKDNVTDVVIPDSLLENNDTTSNYKIYAFIYLTDQESGQTEYKVSMDVKARPRPEQFDTPESSELFRQAILEVNRSAESAKESVKESESWAHGREDYPDRQKDNAMYYAKTARDIAEKIPAKVENAKRNIDEYVEQKKETLKGETGNVNFAAFRVVGGRLKMYSDPTIDKVCFERVGSRLKYRLAM